MIRDFETKSRELSLVVKEIESLNVITHKSNFYPMRIFCIAFFKRKARYSI